MLAWRQKPWELVEDEILRLSSSIDSLGSRDWVSSVTTVIISPSLVLQDQPLPNSLLILAIAIAVQAIYIDTGLRLAFLTETTERTHLGRMSHNSSTPNTWRRTPQFWAPFSYHFCGVADLQCL